MEYKSRTVSNPDNHRPGIASAQTLEQTVRRFRLEIRNRFRDQIARDAQRFKKLIIHLVRWQLPPQPGRPPDPQIDAAVRLVQQGRTVKAVLRLQIPDFDRLDTFGRYLTEKALRAARFTALSLSDLP